MKYFITLFLLPLACLVANAQNEEINLTVLGEGISQTEAVNNALRLAVEQAFGTFVSSNTDILNDEVIKDEIATVSSGNIQKFNIISSYESNGMYSVLVDVTVALAKLKGYARNHGSECELDGATFGANVKLFVLNKENSQKALSHLYTQLSHMASLVFNYELKLGEPKVTNSISSVEVPISVKCIANENTSSFYSRLVETIRGIQIDVNEARSLVEQGFEIYALQLIDQLPKESYTSGSRKLEPIDIESATTYYMYTQLDIKKVNEIFKQTLLSFKICDNSAGAISVVISNANSYQSGVLSQIEYDRAIAKNGRVLRALTVPWYAGWESSRAYALFKGYTPFAMFDKRSRHTLVFLGYNVQQGTEAFETEEFMCNIPLENFKRITKISVSPCAEYKIKYARYPGFVYENLGKD